MNASQDTMHLLMHMMDVWFAQGTHTAVMGRLVTTMSVLVLKIQSAQTLRNVKMENARKQVVTLYLVVLMQHVKCLTMIPLVNVFLDTTLLPHQRMVVLIALKILTVAMVTHAVAICVHAVKILIVQTHKPVKMENAKKYPATL